MVMIHTHAKGHSVKKFEWKQTDGQAGGGNCILSRDNAVSNNATYSIGAWSRRHSIYLEYREALFA